MNEKNKILIFLTDSFLGTIFKHRFSQAGLETKVFYSYFRPYVIDLVVEEKPDILLCDIIVGNNDEERGKYDGYWAIEQLKKDERTAKIPIIIISNLGQPEDIKKGLKLGAIKYLIMADHTPLEITEIIKEVIERNKN